MKMKVEYEINNNGDCELCKSLRPCNDGFMCLPFGVILRRDIKGIINQYFACKEYIKNQYKCEQCGKDNYNCRYLED